MEKIDKSNGIVNYNDDKHLYWTNDNESCISVTTLIDKFATFDREFWSSYKALQSLAGDAFDKVKKKLQKSKHFDISLLADFGLSLSDFGKEKEKVLQSWTKKADESCERGTAIHKNHETGSLRGIDPELKYLGLKQKDFSLVTDNKIISEGNHIYPEVLLSLNTEGIWIAGQADKVINIGNEFIVLDYKTNAKIEKKGYYDSSSRSTQKMRYPMNDLDDCNFSHYEMQLSTYAYMIQNMVPGSKIKSMYLIHYDHTGKCTWIECKYRKDTVEKMFIEYKRRIGNERFARENKPFRY